jgi:hypothetical protein
VTGTVGFDSKDITKANICVTGEIARSYAAQQHNLPYTTFPAAPPGGLYSRSPLVRTILRFSPDRPALSGPGNLEKRTSSRWEGLALNGQNRGDKAASCAEKHQQSE